MSISFNEDEFVKIFIECSLNVSLACNKYGITRDQYNYRIKQLHTFRQKIENLRKTKKKITKKNYRKDFDKDLFIEAFIEVKDFSKACKLSKLLKFK